MRGFGAVLVAVTCLVMAPAAFAGGDWAGEYEIKSDMRGEEVVSTLTITEAAEGLAGNLVTQRGEGPIANVVATDDKLTFTRTMEAQGQSFDLNYEIAMVDGKLTGKMVSPRGERPFASIVKKGAAAEAALDNPFVGKWDVTFNVQGQDMTATFDVTEKDGALAGIWASQLGEGPVKDAKVADGVFSFQRDIDLQGQEMTLDYSAKIEDGKLVGTITTPQGELPFSGTMAKKEEAAGEESDEMRAAAMLKEMDANGDGKITEDEAPEQMKQYFGMIDSNGDGGIDATEMIMVVQFLKGQGGAQN